MQTRLNQPIHCPLLLITILCLLSLAASTVTPSRRNSYAAILNRVISAEPHQQRDSHSVLPRSRPPLSPFIHTKLKHFPLDQHSFFPRPHKPFLLHHLQRQPSSGLSGELCTTDQQCAPPRRCIDVQSSTPCSTSSGCLCLPPDPVDLICECRDTECMEGDVCSVVGSHNMCVSPERGFPRIDCGGPGNFTAEACSRDSDCAGPRYCVSSEDRPQPCSEPPCYCLPIDFEDQECSCREPDCLEGDSCTDFGDKLSVCITAKSALPSLVCDGTMKFTGESCTSDAQCSGHRFCIDTSDSTLCNNSSGCICLPLPQRDISCGCPHIKCLDGDVCSYLGGNMTACVSSNLNFTRVASCPDIGTDFGQSCKIDNDCKPLHACLDIGEVVQPCGNSTQCVCIADNLNDEGGFTNEQCRENKDCVGSRFCRNEGLEPCQGTELCVCHPVKESDRLCSCEDPECLDGDYCADFGNYGMCYSIGLGLLEPIKCPDTLPLPSSSFSEASTSTTPQADDPPLQLSPSPLPTTNVCIDARALSHIPKHQLVYPEHAVADVLCDSSGSCATAGHMVHYNGAAMMMKTYCGMAGCDERVMAVNSPRYRRGIRVRSRTAGLEFTCFAARYGSRGEEMALAAAVRVGL